MKETNKENDFFLIHNFFYFLFLFFLIYFDAMGTFFELSFSVICVTLPSGVVIFAAANFFYSAVPLHRDMALQMVKTVSDWLTVKHALDLGCDH